MKVLFTAWDYQVTYLEFVAVLVSLVGIGLAIRGTRWAWPFYLLSAVLYGWLFWEFDLLASAALQVVFVLAAIWGWFGWGDSGVGVPKVLSSRARIVGGLAVLVAWLVLSPLLQHIGGAATWLDAFILVGSIAAQLLMVFGYVEAWPIWLAVNAVGTYHYAHQNLWFTALFYLVLFGMAVLGLREWAQRRRNSQLAAASAPIAAAA